MLLGLSRGSCVLFAECVVSGVPIQVVICLSRGLCSILCDKRIIVYPLTPYNGCPTVVSWSLKGTGCVTVLAGSDRHDALRGLHGPVPDLYLFNTGMSWPELQ